MYFLISLYLPTLLVLFCFVFSLSPPHPCLPAPPPLLILPFTVFFFLLYPFFFYLYSRSISLPLYSTLSLFGNAALLLALLFPIYASLLKCPFFFPPFSLSLIGWFPFLLFFSLLIVSLPSHFPFSFVPF